MLKSLILCLLVITLGIPTYSLIQHVASSTNGFYPPSSINVDLVNITLYYNVWEDYGVAVYSVVVSSIEENYTIVEIPLVSNNASYIAVYDENGKPLVFNYFEADGCKWIEVMVTNATRIVVTYGLEGLFIETSIGSYSALINLTSLFNYTFTLTIEIDGVFEVIADPQPDDVKVSDEVTRLLFTKPDEYLITLITLYTPPTATPPSTTTTQTSPQPSSSPSPQTGSPSETAKPGETGLGGYVAVFIVFIMIAIAIATYVLVKKK